MFGESAAIVVPEPGRVADPEARVRFHVFKLGASGERECLLRRIVDLKHHPVRAEGGATRGGGPERGYVAKKIADIDHAAEGPYRRIRGKRSGVVKTILGEQGVQPLAGGSAVKDARRIPYSAETLPALGEQQRQRGRQHVGAPPLCRQSAHG